jgi:AraC-like DNA-binding protein
MLTAFESLGLDAAWLCERASIDRALLDDPDRYLEPSALSALWSSAWERWGRGDLGLRAGVAVPLGALGVLDYLVATAATAGDGIGQACRYFALETTMVRYQIKRVQSDGVHLEMGPPAAAALLPPLVRDYGFAAITSHMWMSAGVVPARVDLLGSLLADEADYREVFRSDVRSGRAANAIVFSDSDWEKPMPSHDSALGALLRRHADDLVARIPRGGILEEVRGAITTSLPDGEPTIASLAKRLGMSTRTLQRRLADGEASFSQLLDETRRNLALAYLDERGLSISEVGLLLGYSEPSAFNRAFKRWMGESPSRYRSRAARRVRARRAGEVC